MSINKSVFECKTCNKNYKSYNSLGNHNRKFHQSIVKTKSKGLVKESKGNNICNICNKIFSCKQSKYEHIKNKVCNNNNNNNIILYDNKIEQLENKIIELENKISNNNIITNNTNNTNTNNGTINNNNITNNIIKVTFGEEDISELSCKDKKMILNSGFNSMIKLIETMHLNDNYKQFQNVQITNLKDKYGKYYLHSIEFVFTNSIMCECGHEYTAR